MGKSIRRTIRQVAKNPIIRPIIAAGSLGTSEVAHGAADIASPESKEPGISTPEAPQLGDAGSELSSDAEIQSQLRRRRGRASTILSGPQGISAVGNSSIRRKTLLAF